MRFLAALPLLVALLVPTYPMVEPAPTSVRSAPTAVELETTATTERTDLIEALQILHAWDAGRARAWSEVDTHALRSLYVSGARAGRADLRLLRAYRVRGFVVRRLVTQVFAVRVLHRDSLAMELSVFDRVAGGEVVRDGHAVALHSSRPVTRTLEFRRVHGGWRVAGISGSGGAPHAARR